MTVHILSESSADEAGIRVFVDAILGVQTAGAEFPNAERHRGWSQALQIVTPVMMHLHYRTDAFGLVIVLDANGKPLDANSGAGSESRLVRLREAVQRGFGELRPVHGREPLRVACGVAAPAIEAWYLIGQRESVSEDAWRAGLARGISAPQQVRKLKREAYGTDRSSLAIETPRARELALNATKDLAGLEAAFPVGFGALVTELRCWRADAKRS